MTKFPKLTHSTKSIAIIPYRATMYTNTPPRTSTTPVPRAPRPHPTHPPVTVYGSTTSAGRYHGPANTTTYICMIRVYFPAIVMWGFFSGVTGWSIRGFFFGYMLNVAWSFRRCEKYRVVKSFSFVLSIAIVTLLPNIVLFTENFSARYVTYNSTVQVLLYSRTVQSNRSSIQPRNLTI